MHTDRLLINILQSTFLKLYITASSCFFGAFAATRLSFQIARVVSQNPVELNVVDLVGGLRLEPLVNQSEFKLARLQLHVVEN
jgi:hypothetical protein